MSFLFVMLSKNCYFGFDRHGAIVKMLLKAISCFSLILLLVKRQGTGHPTSHADGSA